MTATDIVASFPDARPAGKGFMARCPAHEDHTASLSIGTGEDGRVLLHCHAGCELDAVLAAAHLTRADIASERRPSVARATAQIVAAYDYVDRAGGVLYQVVRLEPKGFRQRKPDGYGGWSWKIGDTRRVLYRLPDLLGRKTVIVVEGEKDADQLHALGYAATTNCGGAGKWRDEYSTWLHAAGVREVVVLPDNDAPGRQHADQVAASCRKAGLAATVIALADVPSKGDVSDYLETHDRTQLDALITTGLASAATPASTTGGAPLDALLVDVERYLRRYVVVTDEQAIAITLWVAHTHAIFDAADCTPYLSIQSATRQAGKTRLLEVLEPMVARPWLTGRVSAAVLVRKTDAEHPTLLLDESDAALTAVDSDYSEALRGLLNTGYRRSGRASLCVGQGAAISYKDFSTFGAKAIAGIGKLPDTVADRSIAILLRRRLASEPVARWRDRDGRAEAAPLHDALAAWVLNAISVLRDARPALPESLADRAVDVWEPLIAIADLAGGDWADRARRAAIVLTGAADDSDVHTDLLADIYGLYYAQDAAVLGSTDLAQALAGLVDRPWGDWGRTGRAISPAKVARLLKPFGIVPTVHRIGSATPRGYSRGQFEDVWARYGVGNRNAATSSMITEPDRAKHEPQRAEPVAPSKTAIGSMFTESSCGVALPKPEDEEAGDDGYRIR